MIHGATMRIVKLTHPANDSERDALFEVVEDNGDRLQIRLICDLPYPPVETVRPADIESAQKVPDLPKKG